MKLPRFLRREQIDAEMTEEMRQHLELQAERHRAAGLSAEEARYAAERQFGNVASIQERAREGRGWVWLEQFRQDFRFALRGLVKAPGYSLVALLTLALGIGSTTAIFSVIYGVLLDPYPYAKSAEIWAPEVADKQTGRQIGLQLTDYVELAQLPGVAAAMATNYAQVTLSGDFSPELVTSPQVTGSAFAFLDVPPVLGRGLSPADFLPSGEARPVTVLSFKLWQRLFNGDPAVLGKTVVLDEVPHTIVGVMPPRFGWYTNDGLWRPLPTLELKRFARVIARLKPGVSPETASQQLLSLLQSQARRDPARFPKEGVVATFRNYLDVTVASGAMRTNLLVLLCAVGFLLLIACTNVANLQLARGAGRGRELAVRLALGASRNRLVRQLLTESVALAVVGGIVGVILAYGFTHLIVVLLPESYVPNESRVAINGWVLAFSTVLAVVTGIVAGLAPAWQCTRPDVNEAIKDGGQGSGSRQGKRTRHALAVAQVMLSVLLLVGAGLLIHSFVRLQQHDRGFNTTNMLLLRVPLNPKRYTTFEQRQAFVRDFLARLQAVPGVVRATIGLPPSLDSRSTVEIPGQPKPTERLAVNYADPDYLAAYGLILKDGRYFTAEEIAAGSRVALISETTARLWQDGTSPIGQIMSVEGLVGGGPNNLPAPAAAKEVTIIGVLKDVRTEGPQKPAPATVYLPYTLRAPATRSFVVRTALEPAALLNSIRAELRALDKEQPMFQPLTFDDFIEQQAKPPRFNMALFSALAGVALLLAAAGIYSVLSYAVVQRAREIGVRMALGAGQGDVRWLFLREGGRLVGTGLVLGTLASLALARVLENQLLGGSWLDPLAFGSALLLLGTIALIACWLPARRATKVDPMVVLRAE